MKLIFASVLIIISSWCLAQETANLKILQQQLECAFSGEPLYDICEKTPLENSTPINTLATINKRPKESVQLALGTGVHFVSGKNWELEIPWGFSFAALIPKNLLYPGAEFSFFSWNMRTHQTAISAKRYILQGLAEKKWWQRSAFSVRGGLGLGAEVLQLQESHAHLSQVALDAKALLLSQWDFSSRWGLWLQTNIMKGMPLTKQANFLGDLAQKIANAFSWGWELGMSFSF